MSSITAPSGTQNTQGLYLDDTAQTSKSAQAGTTPPNPNVSSTDSQNTLPVLSPPLISSSALSLEALMAAIGNESRRLACQSGVNSLDAKAKEQKEVNTQELEELQVQIEEMAKSKVLDGFLKAFQIIGVIVGAIASVASIVAGAITANPLLIAAGVMGAIATVDGIMSLASDGEYSISAGFTELGKACGMSDEDAAWFGMAMQMVFMVATVAVSLGAGLGNAAGSAAQLAGTASQASAAAAQVTAQAAATAAQLAAQTAATTAQATATAAQAAQAAATVAQTAATAAQVTATTAQVTAQTTGLAAQVAAQAAATAAQLTAQTAATAAQAAATAAQAVGTATQITTQTAATVAQTAATAAHTAGTAAQAAATAAQTIATAAQATAQTTATAAQVAIATAQVTAQAAATALTTATTAAATAASALTAATTAEATLSAAITAASVLTAATTAAATAAAKIVSEAVDKTLKVFLTAQKIANIANAANTVATGSASVAGAVIDYDIAQTKVNMKELEAILERLRASMDMEKALVESGLQRANELMASVSSIVENSTATQTAILTSSPTFA